MKEKHIILKKYNSCTFFKNSVGYNVTEGGGGLKGYHYSEEQRLKFVGENNGFYGRHHSEEARRKISESHKGKYVGENSPNYGVKRSEATKKKLSAAKKGKFVGELNPMYHRIYSEETREKMRLAKAGKYLGGTNPNSIKVYMGEKEFDTIKEFAAFIGVRQNLAQSWFNKNKLPKILLGYNIGVVGCDCITLPLLREREDYQYIIDNINSERKEEYDGRK